MLTATHPDEARVVRQGDRTLLMLDGRPAVELDHKAGKRLLFDLLDHMPAATEVTR